MWLSWSYVQTFTELCSEAHIKLRMTGMCEMLTVINWTDSKGLGLRPSWWVLTHLHSGLISDVSVIKTGIRNKAFGPHKHTNLRSYHGKQLQIFFSQHNLHCLNIHFYQFLYFLGNEPMTLIQKLKYSKVILKIKWKKYLPVCLPSKWKLKPFNTVPSHFTFILFYCILF